MDKWSEFQLSGEGSVPLGSVVGLEALQTAQAMKDSVCRWKSRVECTF